MKLTCVGLGPARCVLLHLRHTHILLDCGLWTASHALVHLHSKHHSSVADQRHADHQPEVAAEYLAPFLQLLQALPIQAALLSTPEAVLAVAHLLNSSPASKGIQGPIFATVAALDAAHHLAAELATARAPAAEAAAAAVVVPADQASIKGHGHAKLRAARQAACAASGVVIPPGSEEVLHHCWVPPLDPQTWDKHLCTVKAVRYGETVSLDGYELTATAFPTGGAMGGALWIVNDGHRLVGYLPDWQPPSVQGCFLEMNSQVLQNLDVLMLPPCALQRTFTPTHTDTTEPGPAHASAHASASHQPHAAPSANPPHMVAPAGSVQSPSYQEISLPPVDLPAWPTSACSPATAPAAAQQQPSVHLGLRRLREAVLSSVFQGGSVVLPLPATGVAWGIIDTLCGVLAGVDTPQPVPLLHCSPAARDSLALAQTSAEFMARHLLPTDIINDPEPSKLRFDKLQARGTLVVTSSCDDPTARQVLSKPCVVVVPVTSLRGQGDAWRLLTAWKKVAACACILCSCMGCDPGAMASAIRGAIPDLAMKLVVCDVDGPAHPSQLAGLLCNPVKGIQHLVLEEADGNLLQPWTQLRGDVRSLGTTTVHMYQWLDMVHLKLRPHVTHVDASAALLQKLTLHPVGGDGSHVAAPLKANLTMRKGRWKLEAAPNLGTTPGSLAHLTAVPAGLPATSASLPASQHLLLGRPNVEKMIAQLAMQGLAVEERTPHAAEVQSDPGVRIIRVAEPNAEIRIGTDGATIKAHDPVAQQILLNCLLSQTGPAST